MPRDEFRIDSHKLMYHPCRVCDWKQGKSIYPIYVEISPTSACNHRCTFCFNDFLGHEKEFLERASLCRALSEMLYRGVKSVMFSGDGEPFMHRDLTQVIQHAAGIGLDVGITTNAVLMNGSISEEILPWMKWIKVSVNAGTEETYAKINRCKKEDFNQMLTNMELAAANRAIRGLDCALGMQMLVLPENWQEAPKLAEIARNIGMDYLVLKPYVYHKDSKLRRYSRSMRAAWSDLHHPGQMPFWETSSFKVIFRDEMMVEGKAFDYDVCNSLPFWAYIDSKGDVWNCKFQLRDPDFRYGNIYKESFEEIWNNPKRKTSHDLTNCTVNCRMDRDNKYLWELEDPESRVKHVNFI